MLILLDNSCLMWTHQYRFLPVDPCPLWVSSSLAFAQFLLSFAFQLACFALVFLLFGSAPVKSFALGSGFVLFITEFHGGSPLVDRYEYNDWNFTGDEICPISQVFGFFFDQVILLALAINI
jgi:hypothetical protein